MPFFSQGHALLIGVGADLPGTVEDARGLAGLIIDEGRCAYPPDQVTVLTAALARREAILAALDDLAARTSPDDTAIVYFSGHGYRIASPFGTMHYLLPYGYEIASLPATAISGLELAQKLAAIPAGKLLVLLDCCHAGGLDNIKAPGAEFKREALPPEALTLLSQGRGQVVIASSRADEISLAGKPYSAFTLALMEALCGVEAATRDGYVRVADLAMYASNAVTRRTRDRQHPILNYREADNFVVAYYAGGEEIPKGVPYDLEAVSIEVEPGHAVPIHFVRTEGGAYFEQGTQIQVGGNFAGRDMEIHHHHYPAPPDPAAERAAQAESAYLHMLRRDCNRLPLAEDDRNQDSQQQRRAQLANVYVDLQTMAAPTIPQVFSRLNVPMTEIDKLLVDVEINAVHADGSPILEGEENEELVRLAKLLQPGPQERDFDKHPLRRWVSSREELKNALKPLTALEAVDFHPHLVLLGEPGGGKSTFVNHLAYTLAGIHLDVEDAPPAPLTASLFPLRVILRRWSSTLTRESKPGLELVYDALSDATGLEREAVLRRLRKPDTLVLFDGLDEAPPQEADTGLDRRKILVQSVQDFCTAHPGCRVLVTSRIKPYDNKTYRLDDLPVVTLAKLDEPRIQRFVHNWYAERARVEPDKAAKAIADRDRLLRSLSQRADLREMAETPLLLTMLAAVNAWAGLPESRTELYDKCVEQLLWEWEKRKRDESGDGGGDGLLDLLQEAGLQRSDLERVLWEMTYHAHAASGSEMADLPARDLRERLAAIHPKKGGVNWAWADRVVALMAERGGLFVETDTGVFSFPHRSFQEYLAARWLLEEEDRATAAAKLAESDTWRETVLLACGYLSYKGSFSDVQAIIAELTGGRRFDTAERRLRLLVGGQAWAEFGPHRARGHTGEELTERVPERLTGLMQDRQATPRQRLDAGLLLADLHSLPPDLDDFVPIAAAAELGYDFRMGKYPVTNTQFIRFFVEDGYAEDKPWWTEAAVKDIERYYKDWRKGPRYWGDPGFDRATQPVVGVSWYEAVAYCEWLTEKLRAAGEISRDEIVRLPTEEEWMRAALGPHPQTKGEKRDGYPWGDDFDPALANTKESNLGQATPVHMYPHGKSPEGVWDLAGNVWEWLQAPRARVKGGSWFWEAERAKVSARFLGLLLDWSGYYGGFRCVVVPISRA